MDHSSACPLCRQELPGYAYFQDHPCNKVVLSLRACFFGVSCRVARFADVRLIGLCLWRGVRSAWETTVLTAFPTQYHERGAMVEAEERDARLDTPILEAGLSFPGMPTMCHLWEPRCVYLTGLTLAAPRRGAR